MEETAKDTYTNTNTTNIGKQKENITRDFKHATLGKEVETAD